MNEQERFADAHQRLLTEIETEARDTESWTGRAKYSDQVMRAMARVPRHEFVPEWEMSHAYANRPLGIGHGQTISQPYIVAVMTDLLDLRQDDRVLEVGTGCGYQAAVLAETAGQIYTIEFVPELAELARLRLQRLGYRNVMVRAGDGYGGWPEEAPFDAIMVTAAPPEIPPDLVEQLRTGGVMVIPVGLRNETQMLFRCVKEADGTLSKEAKLPVAFVPMVEGFYVPSLAFWAQSRNVRIMQIRTAPVGERHRLVAVLGPTNTGKTYLAMDRMLGFESGMIGFPLRLLARENYDRAVRIKGPRTVALITGEEKIVPPDARYFLCTVESMPVTRRVAFLAVDEIQMCADLDRGHIFTDRLLHARGSQETMFMGAETIKPLLRRLVPDAEFVSQPRFSKLQYNGPCKISRLPPRSAVVAFSAADVYVIAELIRRQRGGAAVVLGALSPRTRNAQVAMYQDGEVDYLVATDAIGMGLNMKVDHVAFAATRKFDGRVPRALTPSELAQIAGRAGRHMKNGTFGTTTDIGAFDPEVVERIENHRFDPLRAVFWRNSGLNFTSVATLRASLSWPPGRPELVKAREADDEVALSILAKDPRITDLARGSEAVSRLWEVCKISDFGKVMSDAHARLLAQIYRYLAGSGENGGRLPTDWVARQVVRISRVDGDIEALMQRIANIRTWTYVSYHGDWLDDAAHWQERTRGIEDKLSDALHERLIQRFVDRRTALLVGRMKERTDLLAAVNADDEVLVEGHFVGTLKGFRFVVDPAGDSVAGSAETGAGRVVTAAALRALRSEIMRRIARLEKDGDETFSLTDDGSIGWRGAPVARLGPSGDVFRPSVEAFASDLLDADPRERIRRRLVRWLDDHLRARLAPLFQARSAGLSGTARGLVFQVAEALGSLPRRRAATQIAALSAGDRKALRTLGLRIGRESVYFPPLLKPRAIDLRGQLWAIDRGLIRPELPAPGRMSVPLAPDVPKSFYEAIGYRPLGARAVRVDIVERLAARAYSLSRHGEFTAAPELLTLAGCSGDEMAGILSALGYQAVVGEKVVTFRQAKRGKGNGQIRDHRRPRKDRADPDSPFANLRALRSSR